MQYKLVTKKFFLRHCNAWFIEQILIKDSRVYSDQFDLSITSQNTFRFDFIEFHSVYKDYIVVIIIYMDWSYTVFNKHLVLNWVYLIAFSEVYYLELLLLSQWW